MKNKILFIFKLFFILTSIFTSLYFFKMINDLNMIPNKIFIILSISYLVINVLNILCLISKKVVLNIIGIILFGIIVFVSCFGIKHATNVSDFINKTFNYTGVETTTYDVIVLSSSKYNSIEDLSKSKMGYVVLDENKDECIENIKSKVNVSFVSYDDPYTLYTDLKKNKIDSVVISEGFYDLLSDENENINESIRVIYSFDIEEKTEEKKEDSNELKTINVLISGSDSRSGKIYTRTRSDVNMIATIDPVNHKILLTSIPRDYYVQLHGTKGNKDKLTHAGIYGMNKTKTTIEDLFDIKIDYSLKIGFQSVIQIVDLIDGIDIDSDKEFTSHCKDGGAERTKVLKGINHFTGPQALSYARERYAYLTGDNHRVQNQQQVLEAIIYKITSDKSLLNKYEKILNSFGELYRTDISSEYIKLIIKDQLTNMNSWTVEKQQVSGEGAMLETYSMPGLKLWVMKPDMNSVNKCRNKILDIYNKGE